MLGYTYTIKFYGHYGIRPIPQLIVNTANLSGLNVYQDTMQYGEIFSHYSARYTALDENRRYFARISAVNSRGISTPSAVVTATTDLYGGLPGEPQSVVFGQYKSSTSISLSFQHPIHDGGLPVTAYLVEVDSSLAFSTKSSYYQSQLIERVAEVQLITTSFRAGDNVKLRGGTFVVWFGGQYSPPLSFDISGYELQIAINTLLGTRSIAADPVVVSRMSYNRGFRWFVTFQGIPGDIGLLQCDGTMLTGDNPIISSEEVVAGSADIAPGEFTHEVQTVSTNALSVASGSFTLTMEGYTTDAIMYNETADSFQRKLEAISTVYTVKVNRIPLSQNLQLYTWTVTFTYMRRDLLQASGKLPPMVVGTLALEPAATAKIIIFEAIQGTEPFELYISSLQPGIVYNARITAYNSKGYSVQSSVASSLALGQPPQPSMVTIGIASGKSLNVTWQIPSGFDFYVDSFLVESFSSYPLYEVQVITTSSAGSLVAIQRITVDADANNLGGFFTLMFEGLMTGNIPWNANAVGENSVAISLTRLWTVGPVEVTRILSQRVVMGLAVSVSTGNNFATVVAGSATPLGKADTIWIGGQPFTIVSISGGAPVQLALNDTFTGPSLSSAYVFKWSYGYSWDVTFISKIGPIPQLIAMPSDNWAGTNPVLKVENIRAGVFPLGGTFRVTYQGSTTPPLRANFSDFEMKAALEELDTISEVRVSRFPNGYGFDWRVTFVSELGDLPSLQVNDAGLTGPFAAARVSTAVHGTVANNYSSILIQGANSRSIVLQGLQQGLPYQVRVKSHNIQGYSYPATSTPAFLSPKTTPSPPYNITIFALSSEQLRVTWYAPISNGGAPISEYMVQWDVSSSFQNVVTTGNSRVLAVTPGDGPVYCYTINITPTSANVGRFARVSAYNGFSWSPFGYPTPLSATGQVVAPGAPGNVLAVPTDSYGILVTWNPPDSLTCFFGGDGGASIVFYVVEWDFRPDFRFRIFLISYYSSNGH